MNPAYLALALAGIPAVASVINTAISGRRSNSYSRTRAPKAFRPKKSRYKPRVNHKTARYQSPFPKQIPTGRSGTIERLL